jgi:hypothetical protein
MTPSTICLILLYAAASGTLLLSISQSSARSKRLFFPMALNFAAAIGVFILALDYPCKLLAIDPFGMNHNELFVLVLLACVCAVFVEVPGFLLNLAYDKQTEDTLQTIADILLDVRFSPTEENRRRLNASAEARRGILNQSQLGSFISKCAVEFVRLGNVDSALLNILTQQVYREQMKVADRSKHPFPVLIQLLGLSSVVFVLAEILAILRMR